ncbi:MAG: RNA-binding protein [Kiritimatiellae bacterium]|nr:RNA-binding protein [Kiritimatiellia bacterium]
MMNLTMLAAAATTTCAKCNCPPHAIAALAGAFVVGGLIGYFVGHRGKTCDGKGKCAKKGHAARETRTATPRQPIPVGSVEIYVGNLSYELTEEQLRKEFEAFGTVATARVVTDKSGTRSKGFGFVVMPNRPEAEKAIAAMSEKEVMGRKMRVNEARNTIKEDEA